VSNLYSPSLQRGLEITEMGVSTTN